MLLPLSRLSLFCVTKTCRKPPVMMLHLMCLTLLPVFQAQGIVSQARVIGYLRRDVFLPCQFVPGPSNDNVTQVQWGFKETKQNETVILVSNYQLGVNVPDTFLKDKVQIQEQSLIVRGLAERDAGLYTCKISAFPSGSFETVVQLVVRELKPLSSGEVAAIVMAVLSLFVLSAAVCFLLIRRPNASSRRCGRDDTRGPVVKDEGVVYSDIRIQPYADATYSYSNRCAEPTRTDDVTYSEVLYPKSKS